MTENQEPKHNADDRETYVSTLEKERVSERPIKQARRIC